jgi:hypothetical protein
MLDRAPRSERPQQPPLDSAGSRSTISSAEVLVDASVSVELADDQQSAGSPDRDRRSATNPAASEGLGFAASRWRC